jgi:hypothetical protein
MKWFKYFLLGHSDINTVIGDIAVAVLELEDLLNIKERLKTSTKGVTYGILVDHNKLIVESTKKLVGLIGIVKALEDIDGKDYSSSFSRVALLNAVLKNELPAFLKELREVTTIKPDVTKRQIITFNPN